MTLDELLPQLNSVKQRGRRWSACCPAHADKSPSLSVSEGERGLLLKCWAGCDIRAICAALGIQPKDLFFNAVHHDARQRKKAAKEQARKRVATARIDLAYGLTVDALREADSFVRSRSGLDIPGRNDTQLNNELNALADACLLLEQENLDGQLG